MINGEVKLYVSFTEDKNDAFAQNKAQQPLVISDENLKTEKNYYIIVESITTSAEILLVVN